MEIYKKIFISTYLLSNILIIIAPYFFYVRYVIKEENNEWYIVFFYIIGGIILILTYIYGYLIIKKRTKTKKNEGKDYVIIYCLSLTSIIFILISYIIVFFILNLVINLFATINHLIKLGINIFIISIITVYVSNVISVKEEKNGKK